MINEYTLTVFTENQTGLLQRVVTIFTRRHINIDSLTTSKSSLEGIHRFTIVVNVTEDMVQKLVAQLEKQIDVVKAFYDENDAIVQQELALYKVPTAVFMSGITVETLVRSHNARILTIEKEYVVIEKTGLPNEIEALLEDLKKIGIFEFVRSGRVVVAKPMERLNTYLQDMEAKMATGV